MLAPSPKATVDILADERWQLVQRIVSSPPFQKSTRLRELLKHVTERTIHGHAHELTEQQIGSTLFHKPLGYSSLEDSSVRVHARQLRLKLHEYFDEEGRNEPLILSVPKGSYTPIFKPAAKAATPIAESAPGVSPAVSRRNEAILAWTMCGVLIIPKLSDFFDCCSVFGQRGENQSGFGVTAGQKWFECAQRSERTTLGGTCCRSRPRSAEVVRHLSISTSVLIPVDDQSACERLAW